MSGKTTISGGKSNKRGTPQGGVISPLLSNLYMNRFLKHWRLTGTSTIGCETSSLDGTKWANS